MPVKPARSKKFKIPNFNELRRQLFGENPVGIPMMNAEEGALLLLRRARYIAEDAQLDAATEADQATGKEIATQLGGLPLALDQAGAYIEETACGLSGYLDLYRRRAPDLLWLGGTLDYPDPVASTWMLSFENIEKANPAAAELLKLCAFLHPDAIPEEVLCEGASELGPVLGVVASDDIALNRAMSEIRKYSLLRRDPNARTLEIHRLVQTVLRQGMDEATQRLWAERAVRAVSRAFPSADFLTWAVCERVLTQAVACAKLINRWGFEFTESARLLNRAGFYLYERGRYTDAEPLVGRALAIWEKVLGPEHPDVAKGLNNLAELYRAKGRYKEAEPLYQGFTKPKADTRKLNRSLNGRWKSGKKCWGWSIPTWRPAWKITRFSYEPYAVQRKPRR